MSVCHLSPVTCRRHLSPCPRLAIFPGSIVPSCDSKLNSRALLILAALKICIRDIPAFCNCFISRYPFTPGRFPYVGLEGVSVAKRKLASLLARYATTFAPGAAIRCGTYSFLLERCNPGMYIASYERGKVREIKC